MHTIPYAQFLTLTFRENGLNLTGLYYVKVKLEDALEKEIFGVPLDIPRNLVQGERISGVEEGTREVGEENHEKTLGEIGRAHV